VGEGRGRSVHLSTVQIRNRKQPVKILNTCHVI
jgi:hypothetical protein